MTTNGDTQHLQCANEKSEAQRPSSGNGATDYDDLINTLHINDVGVRRYRRDMSGNSFPSDRQSSRSNGRKKLSQSKRFS